MNREDAKLYLPFVQALIDGASIQFRLSFDEKWSDVKDVSFAFPAEQYRVKPKPLVAYVNQYEDNRAQFAYSARDQAIMHSAPAAIRKGVKLIEAEDQS